MKLINAGSRIQGCHRGQRPALMQIAACTSLLAFILLLATPGLSQQRCDPAQKSRCYSCPIVQTNADAPATVRALFETGETFVYYRFQGGKTSSAWAVGYGYKPISKHSKSTATPKRDKTDGKIIRPPPLKDADGYLREIRISSTAPPADRDPGNGPRRRKNMAQKSPELCSRLPRLSRANTGGPVRITKAYYRAPGTRKFKQVLGPSGLADIFVAYAQRGGNNNIGFWESRFWGNLNALPADVLSPCEMPLARSEDGLSLITASVRDQGIGWLENYALGKESSVAANAGGWRAGGTWRARKAHGVRTRSLVLWHAFNARYYDYIVSYSFKDDGVVEFTSAATARNRPGMERVEHFHVPVWRMAFDFGAKRQQALCLSEFVRDRFDRLDGRYIIRAPTDGEGIDRAPQLFRRLHVYRDLLPGDSACSALPRNRPSYRIQWLGEGSVRDPAVNKLADDGETSCRAAFFKHDAWQSSYRPAARDINWTPQIVPLLARGAKHWKNNIVLWLATPVLHIPRSEDGVCREPGTMTPTGCKNAQIFAGHRNRAWHGVAPAMSSSVTITPDNMFAGTPFYTSPTRR